MRCLFLAAALTAVACAPAADPSVGGAASSSVSRGDVVLSDAQLVLHAYETVLAREPDAGGFDGWVRFLQDGGDPAVLFQAFVGSGEVAARPELADRGAYVARLYRVLLEREAGPDEVAAWVRALDAGASAWDVFGAVAASPEYASVRRPIAGVHVPMPIAPRVDVGDADWVAVTYRVVLGREPDGGGLRSHVRQVRAAGRAVDFASFVGSAELLGNPALTDPRAFARRLYEVILRRTPAEAELDFWVAHLGAPDGAGGAPGWREALEGFLASPEYAQTTCHASYYTYGEPIARDAPLLADVATGAARIQSLAESAHVVDVPIQDGSKLAFWRDPATGRRFAFSRFSTPAPELPVRELLNVRIYELTSSSPPTIVQITGDLFDRADYAGFAWWMMDPHLAIDESVCPRRYVLTMECDGSLCQSWSTTPLVSESWTPPVQVIAGSQAPYRSASVGHAVFDHARPYLSWTEVDNGMSNDVVEGGERATSSAIALPFGLYGLAGLNVADLGHPTVLDAEADVDCTSSWDCNNKDAQDWKKEGAYFYLIYNGANYFGCDRGERNRWGVSVARSRTATGAYGDNAPPVLGDDDGRCDLSYPMVHAQDGRLVVTYGNHVLAPDGRFLRPEPRWAELVWR